MRQDDQHADGDRIEEGDDDVLIQAVVACSVERSRLPHLMRYGAQSRQEHRHGESGELPGRGDRDCDHRHRHSQLEAPFAGRWKDRGNRPIELPDDARVGDPARFERFSIRRRPGPC